MGASVQRNEGSSRRRRGARGRPMSEINVTPMVDVMLVLLIIFMVAAPLLTVGVPVDLPRTEARPLREDTEPLAITVFADGRIFIQDTLVSRDDLVPKLIAIAGNGYDQRIYLRGEKSAGYGTVMEVMALINAAGFTKIALINEQAPPSDRSGNE
ncbi:MAG TPA: biopolymer transporter ExbD [Micropepsaceae bacterium]|nr:biopolymer transporter ExbD [Micropepsaceae bacterium]HRK72380.1 biopolymer transporter ExbD [Micropepsaceae bacterium]